MCQAIDAANFFIDIANSDPDDCMTNLRVNKLLYFAQAWSLVRHGRRLFDDEIRAWRYGPVVPKVYQAFKSYGRERISAVSGDYSVEIFSDEELGLLIDIMREYGKYTSPALVDMTHAQGSPWENAYVPGDNNVIADDGLISYFSEQEELRKFDALESKREHIGYRDTTDGILVLPKEYDDAW